MWPLLLLLSLLATFWIFHEPRIKQDIRSSLSFAGNSVDLNFVEQRSMPTSSSSDAQKPQFQDFLTAHNLEKSLVNRWKRLHGDLRPLNPSQFEYKTVDVERCHCQRRIKALKSKVPGQNYNDTSCSKDAFERGNGQKVQAQQTSP